jgi:hypothetical protein
MTPANDLAVRRVIEAAEMLAITMLEQLCSLGVIHGAVGVAPAERRVRSTAPAPTCRGICRSCARVPTLEA